MQPSHSSKPALLRLGFTQAFKFMKKILALSLFIAGSNASMAAEVCPFTEQSLAGAWSRSSHTGEFEEFLLDTENGTRTFHSWLHQVPELSAASWKVENCRLVVTSRLGEYPQVRLKILGLRKGKLRLYDEAHREESIYTRVPDKP